MCRQSTDFYIFNNQFNKRGVEGVYGIQFTIVYTGKEFRDKIAPVGWSFPVIRPLKAD